MGRMDTAERVPIETVAQWRGWLESHAGDCDGVWVVLWRPATGKPRIDYEAAICEALCVGWIDGQSKPLDEQRSMLWFAPRSPRSAWAGTNKRRVAQLTAEGRMRPAGQQLIDVAKQNGMWTVLDGPEAGLEPPELAEALDAAPAARTNWDAWPRGIRKAALTSIALAQRAETKAARIAKIVADAAEGRRPG